MKYAEARDTIRDGDVLLFRSKGWVARTIRWATRSTYSHAGLAAWWGEDLMLLESREFRGCRALRLSNALAAGEVHLFTASPFADAALNRRRVVECARVRLGQSYGWKAILQDAVGRLPVLALLNALGVLRKIPVLGGLLARLPWGQAYSVDDLEDPTERVKCSTYVAWAWRMGGLDLVPNLADRSTDPGDLSRSIGLRYVGALEP